MQTARRLAARLAGALGSAGLVAAMAVAAPGMAQAAVPDKWGFAFINKPAVAGIPDPTHQAGSWPAPLKVHSAPGAVGQVFVRFPHIATKGGVVHVTAVDSRAVWCQAQKWGPSATSEVVAVRCFRAGGAPVFAPFVVLFSKSSKGPFPAGRAYGYVHYKTGPGIVARFNSAGMTNTVTHVATGIWVVRMPGLGSAVQAGGVQVTPVDATAPAKCELGRWVSAAASQRFEVRCFHPGVVPFNTGWTISYQRRRSITGGGLPGSPKLYAYTINDKPLIPGPYAPPAPVNFNSAGGTNTIMRAGGGLSLIKFPRVGVLPNAVLVTGHNIGAGFCNLLTLWATSPAVHLVTVRDVACYDAAGALQSHQSLISYTSSR